MSKFAIRILTLAMFVMALAAAPLVTKVHANPDSDAPPPSSTKSKAKKKTSELSPSIEDAALAKGYRAAYATIIAAMPLMPAWVQKLVSVGFGAQMLRHSPEQVADALDAKTPEEAAEKWTLAAGNTALGALAVLHAGGRGPEGGSGSINLECLSRPSVMLGKQERCMGKFAIRILTLAMFVMALAAGLSDILCKRLL